MHESLDEFEILRDSTMDYELAALERMKKVPWTYNGENNVITFSQLFLIGSFSYFQVMRTCIRA